jgi:pimeloyl-ACP methyl ester carboxylesterase
VAPDGDLYLLGRSLGGAVATFVASHPATPYDLFSGLIIENTFTSISDMVDIMFYPPISTFKEQILEIDWNTFELVPSVTLPVLFVSGDEDELVPDYMTSKLY